MLTILIFFIILGLLIFVHELGHFVAARRNGITADEFGFGFPPRLVGVQRFSVPAGGNDSHVIFRKSRWRIVWGSRGEAPEKYAGMQAGTLYSLNWIPLGGFVRIKGEDGSTKSDPDSFASKSAWTRVKVLGAGVMMNFVLAWLVIALAFWIGAPQDAEQVRQGGIVIKKQIQISQVQKDSPADQMGVQIGDEIVRCLDSAEPLCAESFLRVEDVQRYIHNHIGGQISLQVIRAGKAVELGGQPSSGRTAKEGALGIGLVRTAVVRYPWYQAILEGLLSMLRLTWMTLSAFGGMLRDLVVGHPVAVDVSGPVGIVYFTKQVTQLGFIYILQFIAILSINLGIINALPLPALDGGRILFILIEKLKGSPVSHKVENVVHTIGFALLITLMIFVTFRDVIKFNIIGKILSLF